MILKCFYRVFFLFLALSVPGYFLGYKQPLETLMGIGLAFSFPVALMAFIAPGELGQLIVGISYFVSAFILVAAAIYGLFCHWIKLEIPDESNPLRERLKKGMQMIILFAGVFCVLLAVA